MLYNNIIKKHLNNVLSRNLDHFGREINYFIGNLKKAEYSYDESNGRLKIMNAVNGGNFEFGYMENTSLQNRITYPNGMVKNTSFEEKRNLITGINYQNGANVISNYSYENDVLGRRTNIGTTYDNATKSNNYNYNPRSEVIGAHGDTLNQAFDYDNIGNRIASSNNDITTNYSTNNLNQYETVGDFVPLFDADGNQTKIKTSKGEFLVEYNGENRPIKFTNLSDSTFITMKYDYMGRRGGKLHFNSQGTWTSTVKFFYKDFTLIEESSASNDVLKEFVWDPTAGSATRPLFLRLPVQAVNLLYCHDANKNVTEVSYLSTANGIGAHYEYDSFGNTITSTRNTRVSYPDLRTYNPFRFSSEYHDDELSLIYYNYRHYNPLNGRWISRDPIEEDGGYNLYSMCVNNVINHNDLLGEHWLNCMSACIQDNDPIDMAVEMALASLGASIPKTFVITLAEALGDFELANTIKKQLRMPGASPFTTLPSAISAKLRLGGRSSLRMLGRYANAAWIAYGLAMAFVETHCGCVCTVCSCLGVDYDSSMSIKSSLKSYFK